MKIVRDWVFRTLYQNNLTKAELLVMLYLIKHCDEKGQIEVYYNDIKTACGLSRSYTFAILNRLAKKARVWKFNGNNTLKSEIVREPLIKMEKNPNCKAERLITINYNDFTVAYGNKQRTHTDFVKLDRKGLDLKFLRTLSAGAISVCLYKAFRTLKAGYSDYFDDNDNEELLHGAKNDMRNGYYKDTYKSISKQLNINIRMLKVYLKELCHTNFDKSKVVTLGKKVVTINNKRYDSFKICKKFMDEEVHGISEGGKRKKSKTTQLHNCYLHSLKNIFRRSKININMIKTDTMEDIAALMTQYAEKARESNYNNIVSLITKAVNLLFTRKKIIEVKALHVITKKLLQADRDNNLDQLNTYLF